MSILSTINEFLWARLRSQMRMLVLREDPFLILNNGLITDSVNHLRATGMGTHLGSSSSLSTNVTVLVCLLASRFGDMVQNEKIRIGSP